MSLSRSKPAKASTDFHAIATNYRGYNFRSQAEARWAVFFDQCGWKWSFEPIVFAGWIPDFAIGQHRKLVEVKCLFDLEQFSEPDIKGSIPTKKIRESGCDQPVILCGADATWIETHGNIGMRSEGIPICWIYQPIGNGVWEASELHFGITEGNGKLGLCPMDAGWRNYIWKTPSDKTAKWSRVTLSEHEQEELLVSKWAYACNVAQWMPIKEDAA